jgi:hypothetical protein
MKISALLFAVALSSTVAQTALAHDDHHHKAPPKAPISEEEVKTRAQEELQRLVTDQKVEASWKEAGKLKSVEQKKKGSKKEWLATFENDTVAEKKLLYVFLSTTGDFVAANFTGK